MSIITDSKPALSNPAPRNPATPAPAAAPPGAAGAVERALALAIEDASRIGECWTR